MMIVHKKPSDKVIKEIYDLVEANYPSLPPATEINRLAVEVCNENGITDPCKWEIDQALVAINYHLSKKTSDIISNKYIKDMDKDE